MFHRLWQGLRVKVVIAVVSINSNTFLGLCLGYDNGALVVSGL